MYRIIAAAAVATLSLTAGVAAQDFPNRTIRLIVPFAPGGGTDSTARIAAEVLTQRMNNPVVAENKPGGGTGVAADYVAKSKNDGYTLFWATTDTFSVLPAVKKDLPFRVQDDFEYVAITSRFSGIIAVNSELPFKTVQEVVAYGKANPGKLRYSSAGVGGASHLSMALFAKASGIDLVHVPYQGSAPAMTSAIGGHVDLTVAAPSSIKPHTDSGKLRAIVSADSKRHFQFPDTPTLRESGIPVDIVLYNGVLAPIGTPAPVIDRMRKELKALVDDPKVVERWRAIGYEASYVEGKEFKDAMAKDLATYTDVAKSFGISIE
jgi:tripartite-type tricarboxylate transporter receptor subunit TctC